MGNAPTIQQSCSFGKNCFRIASEFRKSFAPKSGVKHSCSAACYVVAFDPRLAACRGKEWGIMAVAHAFAVSAWPMPARHELDHALAPTMEMTNGAATL
jgi:hypothetical protein